MLKRKPPFCHITGEISTVPELLGRHECFHGEADGPTDVEATGPHEVPRKDQRCCPSCALPSCHGALPRFTSVAPPAPALVPLRPVRHASASSARDTIGVGCPVGRFVEHRPSHTRSRCPPPPAEGGASPRSAVVARKQAPLWPVAGGRGSPPAAAAAAAATGGGIGRRRRSGTPPRWGTRPRLVPRRHRGGRRSGDHRGGSSARPPGGSAPAGCGTRPSGAAGSSRWVTSTATARCCATCYMRSGS